MERLNENLFWFGISHLSLWEPELCKYREGRAREFNGIRNEDDIPMTPPLLALLLLNVECEMVA